MLSASEASHTASTVGDLGGGWVGTSDCQLVINLFQEDFRYPENLVRSGDHILLGSRTSIPIG